MRSFRACCSKRSISRWGRLLSYLYTIISGLEQQCLPIQPALFHLSRMELLCRLLGRVGQIQSRMHLHVSVPPRERLG